jgi:hypothetical protein
MPFKQDIQGPNQEEIFDMRKYISELLTKKKPEYEFGSIGKGLVGGLFNAIGGVFGNSDLGGELFGRKDQDMTPVLIEALIKQSGMKEEIDLRKQELAADKEIRKQTMELQRELTRLQIGADNDRQQAEIKSRADILKEQFKHDQTMQSLNAKERSDFAMLQSKLELGQAKTISKIEFENAIKLAEQANGHAMRQLLTAQSGRLQEIAQAHGYDMEKLNMQIKAAEKEGEATRKSNEKISDNETKNRAAIADKELANRKAIADAENKTRIDATKLEVGDREKTAESKAAAESKEQDTKNARAVMDMRGNVVAALDGMTELQDQLGEFGTQYLNGAGIGLRELVTSDTRTAIMGKDVSFNEDTNNAMKEYMVSRIASLSDTHDGNQDKVYEAITNEVKNGSESLKSAAHKVRAAVAPGGDPNINAETYAILDAAISKQRATFENMIPDLVEDVSTKYKWMQNTNRAMAIIGSGSPAIDIKTPQLKDTLTKRPSFSDSQDKWKTWMGELEATMHNEVNNTMTGSGLEGDIGQRKVDSLMRAIELLK